MSNPVALEQGRSPIDVRIRMSAFGWRRCWYSSTSICSRCIARTSTRPRRRSNLRLRGRPPFLLGITAYVVIPSVMVYLTLVMPRRINRIVSIVVASIYAITIAGAAVGEWAYFVLGSLVEVVLVAIVIRSPGRGGNPNLS